MNQERAWNLLKEISFVRVSGTPEEKRAAEIFLKAAQDAGVDAVIEEFETENAKVYEASLEVLEPEYRKYPVIGIGKTAATTDEGVCGGFKYIENGLDANLTDIAGKIVLVQGRVMPELAKKLKEKGALAYILLAGNIYEEDSIRNELRPSNAFGASHEIPGVKLHMCDGEELVRSKPEKVRVVLKTEEVKQPSWNVVATIEGTSNVYPRNLEETLYVFGENGTVKIGGTSTNNIDVWNFADENEEDIKNKGLQEQTSNVYGNGHTSLYADVIDAIRNDREPYVDAVAGRNAVEMILAIYQSAATGKPVRMPLKNVASTDFEGRFNR